MNKIKACIFDLDGTIVDSMFLFGINIVNTLQSYGVTPPEDIVRIVTPIGYNNCIDYCIDQFKLKTTHEEMLGKMDAFALPYYRDTILAKEYTKDFFEKLKSQNIKICLLTASPRRFFEPCLERVGLLKYFDNAWSSEDFCLSKNNPEIYRRAAKKIGIKPEEIMFFDDNKISLETAKSAGMHTTGVFDETSSADEEIIRTSNDNYIKSFKDLL